MSRTVDLPSPGSRFQKWENSIVIYLFKLSIFFCEDGSTYNLVVGTDTLSNHGIGDNIDDIISQEVPNPASITKLVFMGHVSTTMLKNPGLIAKLLQELPENLPNLTIFYFDLPPKLYNLPKFFFFLNTYIFDTIIEDQPFGLYLSDFIVVATENQGIYFRLDKHDSTNSIESSFSRPQSWLLPLVEKTLQKPNLDEVLANKLPANFFDRIMCLTGSSQLIVLDLCKMDELPTDGWLPLLLAALKTDKNTQKGRKRKRSLQQIGMVGTLKQLKMLRLEKPTLMKHSHLVSFSDTLQNNTTICHLVLHAVDIKEHHDEIVGDVHNRAWEQKLWEPFLDILRHNNTLTIILVLYKLPILMNVPGNNRPYWEEPLSDVLTHQNHTVSTISFGYSFNGQSYAFKHFNNAKYRLDLNYFGLGVYGIDGATADAAMATSELFPKVLISAVEKDKRANEDRRLIPCLFQLLTNNPSLLVNNF